MKTCPPCGNRKVYGLICLNCGYDFKNPHSQIHSAKSTGRKAQEQTLDIWLGTFPSRKDFETYFAEFDEWDEDEPISPFAKEQGFPFYDHDFFVAEYFRTTSNLEKIIKEIIEFDDRAKEIVARYRESDIGRFNFIAIQLEELSPPGQQKSDVGENYVIHYLGCFAYTGLSR